MVPAYGPCTVSIDKIFSAYICKYLIMKRIGKYIYEFPGIMFSVILLLNLVSCGQNGDSPEKPSVGEAYIDVPFIQEQHEAFMIGKNPADNEVRSIAVDQKSNVWIATASGVFRKESGKRDWEPVIAGDERGPSYSVEISSNGDILLGTWNGLYRYSGKTLSKEDGPEPPVSEICIDGKGDYALGPFGIWRYTDDKWNKLNYRIARSVRDALADGNGGLWVSTPPTCSQSSSISGLHRASTSSCLGVGQHSVPPIASRRNHEGDSRSRSIQRKNQAIGTV